MELLRILSLGASFVGTVLLSLGLLKTRQQIADESGTCWGRNPFLQATLSGEQRFVFLGFVGLVTGFSFQLSTTVTFFPRGAEVPCAILLGVALTALGILALTSFMRSREDYHRRRHERHHLAGLNRTVHSMRDELRQRMYAEHPEMLPEWVTLRSRSLRNFEGDLEPDVWSALKEQLITKLEH